MIIWWFHREPGNRASIRTHPGHDRAVNARAHPSPYGRCSRLPLPGFSPIPSHNFHTAARRLNEWQLHRHVRCYATGGLADACPPQRAADAAVLVGLWLHALPISTFHTSCGRPHTSRGGCCGTPPCMWLPQRYVSGRAASKKSHTTPLKKNKKSKETRRCQTR